MVEIYTSQIEGLNTVDVVAEGVGVGAVTFKMKTFGSLGEERLIDLGNGVTVKGKFSSPVVLPPPKPTHQKSDTIESYAGKNETADYAIKLVSDLENETPTRHPTALPKNRFISELVIPCIMHNTTAPL
jgi:hypothetical protein